MRRIVNAGRKIVKGPNVRLVRCGKQGHGSYGTFLMCSTIVLSSRLYVQGSLMVQRVLTHEIVHEVPLVRLVCVLPLSLRVQGALMTMIVK